VIWKNADAEAATDGKCVTLYHESDSHCIHKSFGDDGNIRYVLHVGERDKEFVSAQTGYCVLVSGALMEPPRYLFQKEVSDRVAERVIDDFEAVEVHEEKGNLLLLAASRRKRL
jgi:hypothetical protein